MTSAVGSFRYSFVKFLCCPTPLLPACTPVIGGKALLELVLVAAGTAIIVAVVYTTAESEEVGSHADKAGTVMILLALRRLSFLSFLGISFERSIFWHKVVGAFYLFAMLIHGLTIGEKNATGLVLGVLSGATALAYLFAYFQISFNFFYYFHIAVYCVIAPIVVIHGGKFFGLVAIVWAADWIMRYLVQGKRCDGEISLYSSSDNNSIVKINIAKNPYKESCTHCALKPGMYCFVMIPKINYYEYHPFSIASGPNDDNLTFYIKAEGDWTEKLRDAAKEGTGGETGGITEMPIYLEGPYGNLSIDVFNPSSYPVALFISGGVGITPLLGMLRQSIHSAVNGNNDYASNMHRIIFVWVCRDKAFADKLYADVFQPIVDEFLVKQEENVFGLKTGGKLTYEFHLHVTDRKEGANPQSTKERQSVGDAANPNGVKSVEMVVKESGKGTDEEMVLGATPTATSGTSSAGGAPQGHWKKGRPNFEQLFASAAKVVEAKRAADNENCCARSRVSVSVCGPSPLVHHIRSQTVSSTWSTGVTFDLHEELFFF